MFIRKSFANFVKNLCTTNIHTTNNGFESGKRHLGTVIGSEAYKNKYTKSVAGEWIEQLKLFPKITEPELQGGYSAFVSGFTRKLTLIPNSGKLLKPLKDIIRFIFISAKTGGKICCDYDRVVIFLPAKFGGLGIQYFTKLNV